MKKLITSILMGIIISVVFTSSLLAAGTCYKSGCNKSQYGSSYYCSMHACRKNECHKQKMTGSSYCSSHTCQAGRTSCKNMVPGANDKCDSCKRKEKSTTKSYSSTKKNYSSSKKSSGKSNKKKLSGWDSYDKGYEDVWLDDDYDWDRYQRDSDYADGVDDAMEDWDW